MTLTQRLTYDYYDLKRNIIDNKNILYFIAIVLFIRTFFVSWYLIPSMSMNPTFKEGDVVISTKTNYNFEIPFTDIAFHLGTPEHGDVINFFYNDVRYVKRVLAVGGDVISMKKNVFYLNGKKIKIQGIDTLPVKNKEYLAQEKYTYQEFKETHPSGKEYNVMYSSGFSEKYISMMVMNFDDYTVPAGTYFMIGDNRNLSNDSRFIGVIEHKDLSSKSQFVLINLYDIWNYFTSNLQSIRFLEKVH